jgi:hypothetical protein
MKKTILAIGICIAGTAFAQQNEPDSIHVVLLQNENGTTRVLDTIVPLAQQQQLFTWMEQNGWDAPPPPTPPNGEPLPVFEHEIIIEGDPGSQERTMFVTSEGDTMYPKHPQMMMIRMEGDSGMMPPHPPMPPGQCRKVVMVDGEQMGAPGEGDVVFMRHPAPPPVPGSEIQVNVTQKDTVINGETRKMIIKTERIVMPPAPPTPPTPPAAPNKASTPANEKRDLVVYPNPTSEIISVEFDVAPKEKTTLRVADMNGKVVYTEEITDEQGKHIYREINLSGKGKGTYTVEVKSAKKVIAEKVILQ